MNPQPPSKIPDRNSRLSPGEKARMLRLLVDELIPGSDRWPSASEAGVHGILSLRLFGDDAGDLAEKVADLVGWRAGSLESADAQVRITAVKGFQDIEPDLFDKLYTAAVLAYYETPFVVEAIRETGRPYTQHPHIHGYPMAPFDAARDTPNHQRGSYLRTEDVVPLDTSKLDLETVKTARWGIER
ncbi:MAG: hypothetical protein J0H34_23000 [Rhizobiales bacterium]|nr:hypothetical protein [Hyphomicrobiales bacterium]